MIMHMATFGQLCAALAVAGVAAADSRDRVASLPTFGPPPTAHWSGFVEVNAATDTHLFYYLVESAHAPASDPLVWWMNGGPGASSLAGLFSENGPLLLNDAGVLMENPFAWNARANVLYVEFSAGVGFSYCANSTRTDLPCAQSDASCSPCVSDDSNAAAQNAAFLDGFLDLFPEYAGRPLFITGESYAGIYGPTLAEAIFDAFDSTARANLVGLWLTDPCTDNKAQFGWLDVGPDFLYERGLIDAPLHATLTSAECTTGYDGVGDRDRNVKTAPCRTAWRSYDLAYAGIGDAVQPAPIPGVPLYIDPLNALGPSGGPDVGAFIAAARPHLNADPSPNKVYHLELNNNGYDGYTSQYSACNVKPVGALANVSMLDLYRDLVLASKPAAAALRRILLSSGDVDPVVGLHGTEAAVRAIGYAPMASGRLPWFYNATATPGAALLHKPAAWGDELRAQSLGAQVAGYHVAYYTGSATALEFITFKDAGHMVPAYAPQRALHVLLRLLDGGALVPVLQSGWADATDSAFYGTSANDTGIFAAWVKEATSPAFLDDAP